MDAPRLLPAREAGPLQCAQALRDGRKRDAKRGGQTRDGGLSPGKPGEDGPPGEAAAGFLIVGGAFVAHFTFNHLVKCKPPASRCQRFSGDRAFSGIFRRAGIGCGR